MKVDAWAVSGMSLSIFVEGKLRNPLNGSWGGWRKHARLARDWRDRTSQCVFVGSARTSSEFRNAKKRIIFMASVGRLWDDDNLPAAIKPVRDAVAKMLCPGGDSPESGNQFVYMQKVATPRGVTITIEAL